MAFCYEHRRKFSADEGCELCREDKEMTGTVADETAYCDGCGQHLDECVCLDPAAVMAATPTADEILVETFRPILEKYTPIRAKVLQRGIDLATGDRNKTYGPPEPNLTLQMELWTLYKAAAGDKHSMAHDAAMQHVFAKLARIASGPPLHEDNYVDLSTYSAIAYECDVEVLGAPSC